MSRLRLLARQVRRWWLSERKIGHDHLGNEYYEELGAHPGRSRRTVVVCRDPKQRVAEHADPQFYYQDQLPAQWRAWLSHTRLDPPSFEEVVQDAQLRQLIKQRAAILDEQWQKRKKELLKTEEYQLLLQQTQPTSEKTVVDFEALLKSPATMPTQTLPPLPPSGQGETFMPGEWQPVAIKRSDSKK